MDRNSIIKVTGIKPIYKRKPFHMAPIEEGGTLFFGMEEFPKIFESFSSSEKSFAQRETMTIRDGETLNLANNKDFARYARAIMYDNIALSKDHVNPDKHNIYLNDIYKEAARETDSIDDVEKALRYVATKVNDNNERRLYLYLGLTNYKDVPEVIKKRNIKKNALDHPEKIISFFDDEAEIRYEVFARELIYDGIISETSNGYEYNKRSIATSFSGLVERIAKDKNLRESLTTAVSEGYRNEPINQDESKKASNDREQFLSLMVDYMSLSGGKKYTGKETVEDIQNAIIKLKQDNLSSDAKERIDMAKKKFREEYGDKSLAKLRQSANGSKYPSEEWSGIKSEDEMYKYLFNKKFGE